MEFIITNYFLKIFNKQCKNIEIKEIIRKINVDSKNFINLKYPFYKIKLKIGNKTYRLLIFSNKNFVKILFINFFDKKDKTFGENIVWKLYENSYYQPKNPNLSKVGIFYISGKRMFQ